MPQPNTPSSQIQDMLRGLKEIWAFLASGLGGIIALGQGRLPPPRPASRNPRKRRTARPEAGPFPTHD